MSAAPSRVPPLPAVLVEPLVRAALVEDLGRAGDITTDAIVPPDLVDCTTTSYSSPPCTNVVTRREPIIDSSALPIDSTLTPRSDARWRSMFTRICGRVSL